MMEDPNARRVASTMVGKTQISTVFLGIDYAFSPVGPPLLFETMVFGGSEDGYQTRCSTWEEAEAMHAKAVKLVEDQNASAAKGGP